MAPRLPYAVARSRSTALRPCGCPVSFGFRKKARQLLQASIDSISPSLRKRYTRISIFILKSRQIFPSDRKIYIRIYFSWTEFISQNEPPRISFGHVRGPNHSVPGGRGSARSRCFYPCRFSQPRASVAVSRVVVSVSALTLNQIIDKACDWSTILDNESRRNFTRWIIIWLERAMLSLHAVDRGYWTEDLE